VSKRAKDDGLVTVEEAASILGLGQIEIQHHFGEGTLTKLRASNGEVRVSKAQVERHQYIMSILKDWPEPTERQRRTITNLLYGDPAPGKTGPSAYELEQRRKAAEREEALKQARQAALAMTACDVCNLQPDQHKYAERTGIDSHEWQPGRAKKLMKRGVKA
jgi:hypothetical protein